MLLEFYRERKSGESILKVIREQSDPISTHLDEDEGRILDWIVDKLEIIGFDLVRKKAWEDTRFFGWTTRWGLDRQYIRARARGSSGPHIMIVDRHWGSRNNINYHWGNGGLEFKVYFDIFGVRGEKEDQTLFAKLMLEHGDLIRKTGLVEMALDNIIGEQ